MDENFDSKMTKLYMELERLKENGQTAQADRLLTKIESFEKKSEENQWLREASQFPKKKRRKRNRSVNRKWTEDIVKKAIETFIFPPADTIKVQTGLTYLEYCLQFFPDAGRQEKEQPAVYTEEIVSNQIVAF